MQQSPRRRRLAVLALSALGGLFSSSGHAQANGNSMSEEDASWEVSASPYALHWHHDDEHRHVYQLGLERVYRSGKLVGASIFRNSFGQASGYIYYGHEWDNLFDQPMLYAKLTGGLMYGYRGKYEDKVPLNHGGFSPAIVPGIGYRVTPGDAIQADILGFAGILFSYNHMF